MMDFGWKKKAERLRMTLLSAGHQLAKPLPKVNWGLEVLRRAAETGDTSFLQQEMLQIPSDTEKPLWEPLEIYGWNVHATLYLDNGQLWWLLHAARKDARPPNENATRFLEKILGHLGADPERDKIIGPRNGAEENPPLPFGWWRWFNRWPLYEVQIKGTGKHAAMRVVPIDTPASDGYERLDMTKPSGAVE